MSKEKTGPKILVLDIETSPLITYTWGLFDQNIGLNQIKEDSHILSWSAKWFQGENGTIYGPHNKVMYMDQRLEKDIKDDKELVKVIHQLLDESDIIITQNGKRFDIKKLNARFIFHKMKPPSSFKHIDTLQIAKKNFAFTSNKLEYMTNKLCTKYKKLNHKKYPGFELWKECLAGNREAWFEMETYNKHDVLATQELYNIFAAWDNSINFNLYTDSTTNICKCGSKDFKKNGFSYSQIGKFQRYCCKSCGSEIRDRNNLFSKSKKDSLKVKV